MPLSGYIVVIKSDGGEGPICEWCSRRCEIGRDPSCDISISLPTVAPVHCSLELLDNGLVKATSHSSGRFLLLVDGVELTGSRILPNGCLITVGDRHLKFFYPSLRKSVHFNQNLVDSLVDVPTSSGDCRQESEAKKVQQTNSPQITLTQDSLPRVHPSRKMTPKATTFTSRVTSRSRSATPKTPLGTRERYGPVPPRPIPTPPTIQVLRHTPNASSPSRPLSHSAMAVHETIGSPLREARQINLPAIQQTSAAESPLPKVVLRGIPATITPTRLERSKSPGDALRKPILPVSPTGVPKSPLVTHALRSTPSRAHFSQGLKNVSESTVSVLSSKSPTKTKLVSSRTQGAELFNDLSHSAISGSVAEILPKSDAILTPKGLIMEYVEIPEGGSKHVTPRPSDANELHSNVSTAITETVYPQSAYVKRTGNKRHMNNRASMITEDILRAASKRTKGVSFGPALSPEQFDRAMPPSTPVKKGAVPPNFSTPKTSVLDSQTLTPADDSKISAGISRLASPSYVTMTPGRISGVISIPPTPDDNLLDSYDDRRGDPMNGNTIRSGKRHSAPIPRASRSGYKKPRNVRHSMGTKSTTAHGTPRAPPSTPVSVTRTSRTPGTHRTSVNKSPKPVDASAKRANLGLSPLNQTSTPCSASVVVHLLKKTPKSAEHNRASGTADMLAADEVASGVFENTGRSRSTPGSVRSRSSTVGRSIVNTPNSVRRVASKTPRMTGVRRLVKTPESVKSPRMSGVADMFMVDGMTSDVIETTGHSRSTPGSGRSRSSVVGRSIVNTPNSVRRVASKTPRMTGVRRLLKTPKSVKSPRMSGVADMFMVDGMTSDVIETTGHSRSTPGSARSRSSVVGRSAMRSPKSVNSSRVSGSTDMFVGDEVTSNVVENSGRSRSTPSSVSRRSSVAGRSVVNTPASARRVASKTPRMTGVRRLLKTPKSVKSPRLSGLADMFVVDSSGRSRSTLDPVPFRSSVVERSMVNTPNSVRRVASKTPRMTGVRRLLKTPKSVESSRVSGLADMFMVDEMTSDVIETTGHSRSTPGSGRSRSSVVGRSIVNTPNSVRRVASKTPRMTGVRRLLKTPKSVKSPRMSGVADMFMVDGMTSDVIETTGHSRSTPGSARSRSSVVGRSAMRSPKSVNSSRVSGSTDMFVGDEVTSNVVENSGRSRSTPSSVSRRSSVAGRSVVNTPASARRVASKTPRMTGVRRLLKTPKSVESSRVSGLADMFMVDEMTSNVVNGSGRSLSAPTSVSRSSVVVRSAVKTSESLSSSRVSGSTYMFRGDDVISNALENTGHSRSTLGSVRSRGSVAGRSGLNTSGSVRRVASRTPQMTGVRRLLKTPKSVKSPRVSGLADMFMVDEMTPDVIETTDRLRSTPGAVRSRSSVAGRSGLHTSGSVRRVASRTPRMTGVRRLLKTPKSVKSPRMSGVADMFMVDGMTSDVIETTGHSRSTPGSVRFRSSVRRSIVNTPNSVRRVASKTPRMTGVRRLLKTPKSVKSPRMSGVADMFMVDGMTSDVIETTGHSRSTPGSVRFRSSVRRSIVNTPNSVRRVASKTPRMTGVRRLLKTPKSVKSPRVSGLADMFMVDGMTSGVIETTGHSRSTPGSVHSRSSVGRSVVKRRGRTARVAGKVGVSSLNTSKSRKSVARPLRSVRLKLHGKTESEDVSARNVGGSTGVLSGKPLEESESLLEADVSKSKSGRTRSDVRANVSKSVGSPRKDTLKAFVKVGGKQSSAVPIKVDGCRDAESSVPVLLSSRRKGDHLSEKKSGTPRLQMRSRRGKAATSDKLQISPAKSSQGVALQPLSVDVATGITSAAERRTRRKLVSTETPSKTGVSHSPILASKISRKPVKGTARGPTKPKVVATKAGSRRKKQSNEVLTLTPKSVAVTPKEVSRESSPPSIRRTRSRAVVKNNAVTTSARGANSRTKDAPGRSASKVFTETTVQLKTDGGRKLRSRRPAHDSVATPKTITSPRRTRKRV